MGEEGGVACLFWKRRQSRGRGSESREPPWPCDRKEQCQGAVRRAPFPRRYGVELDEEQALVGMASEDGLGRSKEPQRSV